MFGRRCAKHDHIQSLLIISHLMSSKKKKPLQKPKQGSNNCFTPVRLDLNSVLYGFHMNEEIFIFISNQHLVLMRTEYAYILFVWATELHCCSCPIKKHADTNKTLNFLVFVQNLFFLLHKTIREPHSKLKPNVLRFPPATFWETLWSFYGIYWQQQRRRTSIIKLLRLEGL